MITIMSIFTQAKNVGIQVKSRRLYALAVFFLLLSCYSYFTPFQNWNPDARLALIYAVVDQHVVYIDRYQELTGDKAYVNSHYYMQSSIGPSLLGLPVYAVYQGIVNTIWGAEHVQNSEVLKFTAPRILITFLINAIPSALLGVFVFLMLTRFVGRLEIAFILALVYGLATIAFSYSNVLFQHQIAAFGCFVGFYLIWRVIYEQANTNGLWLAGILFGIATITEYPVVIILGLIFLWALYKANNRIALYRVVMGALPFVVIFLVYNDIAFGTPFTFGYLHSNWTESVHSIGIGGISTPSLSILLEIMFGTFRGLFFISPVLLLVFPGFYLMWKHEVTHRSVIVLLALIIGSFFVYNAGYVVWWGGFSVGPRYLTPMIPFMMLPIAFVIRDGFKNRSIALIIGLLIIISVLNVWIQSKAGNQLPPDADPVPVAIQNTPDYQPWLLKQVAQRNIVANPLFDYAIPSIAKGGIANNWGIHFLKLHGLISLVPLLILEPILYWLILIQMPRWMSQRQKLRPPVTQSG